MLPGHELCGPCGLVTISILTFPHKVGTTGEPLFTGNHTVF